MKRRSRLRHTLLLACSIFLYSCQPPLDVAEGGIGGTGISSGSVTQFGSIHVNGIKFETGSARFTIKGRAATEDEMALGMYVHIKGTRNGDGATGVASEVIFHPAVEGVIGDISADGSQFTVEGQSVRISAMTVLDGTSKAALAAGELITVSGSRDANDTIQATYLRMGIIDGADSSSATGGGNANSSEAFSSPALDDSHWINIDGLSHSSGGTSPLVVGAYLVSISGDTQFVNGQPSDISASTRLLVTGTKTASNAIDARVIEIVPAPSLSVSGSVTSIDAAAGELHVGGQTIHLASTTLMIDSTPQPLRRFSIYDIHAGDTLNIELYPLNGRLVAAKIERF